MGGVVRRYIDILILFSTPLTLALFLAAASLLLCSFLKCFFVLVLVFLCNIANVAQKTFEIVQNSRSRENGYIILSTIMYVLQLCVHARSETSTGEVSRDVSRKLQLTLCAIMAS